MGTERCRRRLRRHGCPTAGSHSGASIGAMDSGNGDAGSQDSAAADTAPSGDDSDGDTRHRWQGRRRRRLPPDGDLQQRRRRQLRRARSIAPTPACSAWTCTAAAVPGGWTVVEYAEKSRPACATGYGSPIDVVEGPSGPAATCDCACDRLDAGARARAANFSVEPSGCGSARVHHPGHDQPTAVGGPAAGRAPPTDTPPIRGRIQVNLRRRTRPGLAQPDPTRRSPSPRRRSKGPASYAPRAPGAAPAA